MVLGGEEGRIEDDEERDARVEEHVVHDGVEHVLEAHPHLVVHAELAAPGTVPVAARLCRQKRRRGLVGLGVSEYVFIRKVSITEGSSGWFHNESYALNGYSIISRRVRKTFVPRRPHVA